MISVFWHRRDLRIDDNHGLAKIAEKYTNVLPIFIFDTTILEELEADDKRVSFIYLSLKKLKKKYQALGSDLFVLKGKPLDVLKQLNKNHSIQAIYTNRDYEPYAISRDREVAQWASEYEIDFQTFKDHVMFEKDEINVDGRPYKVYTPYSKKWKAELGIIPEYNLNAEALNFELKQSLPSLESVGFREVLGVAPKVQLDDATLYNYAENRNLPAKAATSNLGVYLRFGNTSIRKMVKLAKAKSEVFLNELIWREFFMTIMWFYPESATHELKTQYRGIPWENNEDYFDAWRQGKTGFPIVDAGMRQLNETGMMHNRVRMITASFLVKDLCIDWRWGEAYFAKKLMDFELSSNVGNWQWAAGTGTDAAPYFRVFNPTSQQEKFDPKFEYIKKWVPEFNTASYPSSIVNHKEAREKILALYKTHLNT
ncbi:MAG: deoxyribodipyrimidine photo-lyase [Putridiphycobacter sp.]|nr:deoxyribodipyrimidine photo-lyase [Putridiphycobacter sp.]